MFICLHFYHLCQNMDFFRAGTMPDGSFLQPKYLKQVYNRRSCLLNLHMCMDLMHEELRIIKSQYVDSYCDHFVTYHFYILKIQHQTQKLNRLKSELTMFQTTDISYHKTGMSLLLSFKPIMIIIDKIYLQPLK